MFPVLEMVNEISTGKAGDDKNPVKPKVISQERLAESMPNEGMSLCVNPQRFGGSIIPVHWNRARRFSR